jgi:hypothetical protein
LASAYDSLYRFTVDVGEPILSALVAECEFRVIDAAQVQYGRLHIVNMNWVLCHIPCIVIRRTVDMPFFDTASGHPPTERSSKVIPSVRFL